MVAGLLSSCYDYDWKFDHETTLSDFNITSADNTMNMTVNYADSTNNAGRQIQLDWTMSAAGDYSKVFYEVLFYRPQDLSTPVYKIASGLGQTRNYVVLNERDLNVVAEKAGIPQSAGGDVIWKVRASNGVSELITDEYKTISITRPAGFAYYPEKIVVAGTAVNAEKPIVLKRIMQGENFTGEYESFFYLGEGNFYLTEKGTDRRLYITQEGELKELFGTEKETLVNAPVTNNKIHRIKINLKKSIAITVSIESVGLWYSGINDVMAELQQEDIQIPYWSHTRKLELVSSGALSDYRYKFRISQKNMKGENSVSFWGYSSISAPNQSETSLPAYFRLYEVDSSQSNYCYKFSRSGHDQINLKIDVDFRPEADFFRHYITVIK
jgi:tRNA(Leu) C34 or U34 (ribose-2'-O)-methylase TrmL